MSFRQVISRQLWQNLKRARKPYRSNTEISSQRSSCNLQLRLNSKRLVVIPLLETLHSIQTYASFCMYIITQKSIMSRQSLPLPDFIATLPDTPAFPLTTLNQYLNKAAPSKQQCLATLMGSMNRYYREYALFKEVAVAVWVCVSRNYSEGVEQGLNFFQSLLKSRLLLLVFNDRGQFCLDTVLLFLQLPLQTTLRKSLELGWTSRIIKIIKHCNQPSARLNEVLLLLQLLIIKKIRKQLDHQSNQEFDAFLQTTLPKHKLQRLELRLDTISFKHTALLRVNDESSDTFELKFKEGKLCKIPQNTPLPLWVMQAYSRLPPPLDTTPFHSKRVFDVFTFLSLSEVYASSPLIEEFDGEEAFMDMLPRFLMGQPLGEGEYKFGSEGSREAVRQLKERLDREQECYRTAIAQEVSSRTIPQ